MSTDTILMYAIGVFVLMAIGIILTTLEFDRLMEKSKSASKKNDPNPEACPEPKKPEMRIIHSNKGAA